MNVSSEFLKARQLAIYFQQYRELPGAKKKPLDSDETLEEFEHFKYLMDVYRSLDNSPEDYDSRSGHLLIAEETCIGRSMQISYQGDEKNGRISRILVDAARREGFQEDHLIVAGETLHALNVCPILERGWTLEASYWNKSAPEKAHQQVVKIGHKEPS